MLCLALRPVGYHNFKRVKYRHYSMGDSFEIFSYTMFKKGQINSAVRSCYSYVFNKVGYCCWSYAATAKSCNSWHSRIVPSGDIAFFYKAAQFSFAHYRKSHVKARKFDLAGQALNIFRHKLICICNNPIIKRSMVAIFDRAH